MFIARWIFLTVVSFLTGMILVIARSDGWGFTYDSWFPSVNDELATIAFAVSFSQYLLLRRYIQQSERWVTANFMAAVVSGLSIALSNYLWMFVRFIPPPFQITMGLLWTAFILGLFQSRVIYSDRADQWGWIATSIGATVIGVLCYRATSALLASSDNGELAGVLTGSASYGVVTGYVLLKRLVHKNPQPEGRFGIEVSKVALGIVFAVALYCFIPITLTWAVDHVLTSSLERHFSSEVWQISEALFALVGMAIAAAAMNLSLRSHSLVP
jgi:hypothetical protein